MSNISEKQIFKMKKKLKKKCIFEQTKDMQEQENNSKLKTWLKRVGVGGLIFFTVKGLVWLAIFYFGAESLKECLPK